MVLSFEDLFRLSMLFLNKYLNKNRIKVFDLNSVNNDKVVISQLKNSKINTAGHCFMVTFAVIWQGVF